MLHAFGWCCVFRTSSAGTCEKFAVSHTISCTPSTAQIQSERTYSRKSTVPLVPYTCIHTPSTSFAHENAGCNIQLHRFERARVPPTLCIQCIAPILCHPSHLLLPPSLHHAQHHSISILGCWLEWSSASPSLCFRDLAFCVTRARVHEQGNDETVQTCSIV
jgi:hypothetical protein